jgi:hypothetical protein
LPAPAAAASAMLGSPRTMHVQHEGSRGVLLLLLYAGSLSIPAACVEPKSAAQLRATHCLVCSHLFPQQHGSAADVLAVRDFMEIAVAG